MAHDPTDLAGQKEREEESAEAQRVTRLQYAADLRWLMRQRPFRRFIWAVLEEAGVYRDFFSESVALTNRVLGVRSVGLKLLASLQEHCPDDYALMERERREQREMKAND
jgi:hypothetical protein